MNLRFLLATVLGVAMLTCSAHAASPLLLLPVDTEWRIETKGDWQARLDPRALLAMRHPWTPSTAGNFAQATRTVTVPAEWSGPVYLSFYSSDNYHTDTWRPDGNNLTAEGFIGHRFKQVFVNQQIVWSQDIADAVVQGDSPVFRVPIEVTPGEQFQLGVVVFDRTESSSVLDGDFFQAADATTTREASEHAAKFHSDIYWGDFVLCSGDTPAPPGKRPVEERITALHEQHWPYAIAASSPMFEQDIPLQLHAFGPLPEGGFPHRMGLPFPPGKVSDTAQFRLRTRQGVGIPAGKEVLARWPDDSIRWCLVNFIAPANGEDVLLSFKKDNASPASRMKIKESDEGLDVDAGGLSFSMAPGRLLHDVRAAKQTVISDSTMLLYAGAERYNATVLATTVLEQSPLSCLVLAEGRLGGSEGDVASFKLYISTWAGQPYLACTLRIANDGAVPLPITDLTLALQLSEAAEKITLRGGEVLGDFQLEQSSPTTRTLQQAGAAMLSLDPLPPFGAQWGRLSVAMPKMRERFPQGVARSADRLEVQLVHAPQAPIILTPGEASSHELWFALGDAPLDSFANTVARRPVYANPAYFAATGAYGPAHPVLGIPKYDTQMAMHYRGKDWEALGHRYGVRDFPDTPYFGTPGRWNNNYYNRTHGAWAAWLATGDPEWHGRAVDVCRLILDVAIIHSEVPGKDWTGALHGPGDNHVPGPWSPTLRTRGLWLHHMLTGDPEAEQAYLGVADFVVRTESHRVSPSVRDHAGPFDALVTAYDASRELILLDEGAKRVAWAWERMDRRRGVWPETHGSMVYRGNVPWMVAQLAGPLYEWYLMTGDPEAAQLVVAMAESMILENTPWDQPGAMSGYSHNPHFEISAAYDPLILPVLFAAYELSGETHILDAAKAQWQRWNQDSVFDNVFNTFWHTSWLAHYLNRHVPEAFAPEVEDPQSVE